MSKEMRFLTQGGNTSNPLKSVIGRCLTENGGWDIEAMRAPGFRDLERAENNGFRALSPMTDKAQVLLDRAVVEVGLQRLTVTADIMAAGLTYPLSDPLSVAQLEWNSVNKIGAAQRTMNPQSRGENKLPIVTPNRLPIYLTTDEFEIDIRTLKTSQRVGMPLDTSIVKQCVRAVNEAIEDATINGATTLDGQDLKVAGYSAPGLLNAPNAEAQALTLASWDVTPVGSTIFSEVQSMIGKLQANKKYGPYRLYVPTDVGLTFDNDYNATNNAQGLTIRQRILQMENIQAVKTADMLPSTKVVLVQMTSDVIDIVVGQPPTIIPWTSLDGFSIHNLVMAIMIPRVRSDYNGDSGVCIGTIA
jgi:uncharacterized linocin/CFP29 family protein